MAWDFLHSVEDKLLSLKEKMGSVFGSQRPGPMAHPRVCMACDDCGRIINLHTEVIPSQGEAKKRCDRSANTPS